MSRLRAASLVHCLVLGAAGVAGCTSAPLTEVIVIVNAEPNVRKEAASLSWTVTSLRDGSTLSRASSVPWNKDGEYTIGLSPQDAQAGRYRVEVSALHAGKTIATVRLSSGYVAGQSRYVKMLFEDACVGQLCDPDSTCHARKCIAAAVDESGFSASAMQVPATSSLSHGPSGDAGSIIRPRDAGSASVPVSEDAHAGGSSAGDDSGEVSLATHEDAGGDPSSDAVDTPVLAADPDAGGASVPEAHTADGRYEWSSTPGVVFDARTGLHWQRELPATYAGCTAGKTCTGAEATSYCDDLLLAGSWRLPTVAELESIVDHTKPYPGPMIDVVAFPNTPPDTFWTATQDVSKPDLTWNVNFGSGESAGYTLASAHRVRCVH